MIASPNHRFQDVFWQFSHPGWFVSLIEKPGRTFPARVQSGGPQLLNPNGQLQHLNLFEPGQRVLSPAVRILTLFADAKRVPTVLVKLEGDAQIGFL